jgi:hypothetical protein
MDHQPLQVGIRILLTLDIRQEPRQALRFTLPLLIRKLVIRRPGIHKPVIRKPGIRKPVIRKPVIRKPVIRKPVTRKPGIRWRGIHKPGIHKPGIHKPDIRRPVIPVTLGILDTHLMAMLLGMPSKVPCSPRPYFRPMVVKHRWQAVGILTRVIPPVPFHHLHRAIAMAHLVTDRLPMARLGLQVILWVFRRMLRTSWAGTLCLLEPAATKNPAPQH